MNFCKLTALFSALIMLLSLGACKKPDTGYLGVERRGCIDTTRQYFCFDEDETALTFLLPAKMKTEKTADGYAIIREGITVGSVVSGVVLQGRDRVVLSQNAWQTDGIDIQYTLLADSAVADLNARYFHQYIFTYTVASTPRSVTMTVQYSELNDGALDKINTRTDLKALSGDAYCGILKDAVKREGKSILILGNSFIYTSQIGEILQSMCNAEGKNAHPIIAESRGYATVLSSWDDYLPALETDSYAAVFLCGFYGE